MSDSINMKVKNLKDIIKNLPDDMDVIIPVIDIDDANHLYGYRHVRTAGVLSDFFETDLALCLNASENGLDISSQVQKYSGATTKCEKVLF